MARSRAKKQEPETIAGDCDMSDTFVPGDQGPSYRFTVVGDSNYPIQQARYQVDLYNKAEFHLYQNAAFDLVAMLMAKLGQLFSAADIIADEENLIAKISELQAAVNNVEP